jgi:hypothetical protein
VKNRSKEYVENLFAATSKVPDADGIAIVEVPEHVRAQNYRAGALVNLYGKKDSNAVVGYDAVLETYFLHAFEDEHGELTVWLGARAEEFTTPQKLMAAAAGRGIVIEIVHGSRAAEWLPSPPTPETAKV